MSDDSEARAYAPCHTGLHVCGADEERNEFFTEADFPMSRDKACTAFSRAREELCCSSEDADLVVDLMIEGDTRDDFSMHRQMLNRLRELAR